MAILILAAVYIAIVVCAVVAGRAPTETLPFFGPALGILLLWASKIDLESLRLPDRLNAAVAILGAVYIVHTGQPILSPVIGAVAGYGTIYLIGAGYRILRGRAGIGLGDAKLLGAAGVWVGWEGLSPLLLFASAAALVTIVVWRCCGLTVRSEDRVPFGPFLALGLWCCWLLGGDW